MQKPFTTLAVLAVIATPACAQSFDPDNGTGNILNRLPGRTTELQSVRAGYAFMVWFRAPVRLM